MSSSRTVASVVFVCLAAAATVVLFYNAPAKVQYLSSAQLPSDCGAHCPPAAHAVVLFAAPNPAAVGRAPPTVTPNAVTVENIQVPCTKQCAPGSKCVNDVCFCDADHYGRRCQSHYGSARWARDQEHTNSKLYFASATAQSRQQLAAMNLFHCPSIIEVGGLFAGTFQHLTKIGWAGNFTQMDFFGPQDANVTRTTLANGEVRVRRVVRSRQLCGENPADETAHACFVFIGIPDYGGMQACARGLHSAKYQTIVLESPHAHMYKAFADPLQNSTQYKSWGIAADWSEDLRRDGIKRNFPARRFRVFTRLPRAHTSVSKKSL